MDDDAGLAHFLLHCRAGIGRCIQLSQRDRTYSGTNIDHSRRNKIPSANAIAARTVVRIDYDVRIQKESWFPRNLPQLLPTDFRDTLPIPYRFQNFRFCPFSTRASAVDPP